MNEHIRVDLRALCAVFHFRCYYCKNEIALKRSSHQKKEDCHATREHLIPASEGGECHPRNLRPACALCNHLRGTKNLHWFEAFIAELRQRTTLLNRWHRLTPFERQLVFSYCDHQYEIWNTTRRLLTDAFIRATR